MASQSILPYSRLLVHVENVVQSAFGIPVNRDKEEQVLGIQVFSLLAGFRVRVVSPLSRRAHTDSFLDNGPSCPPDEQVRFEMRVAPTVQEDGALESFQVFAKGTLKFLCREFI